MVLVQGFVRAMEALEVSEERDLESTIPDLARQYDYLVLKLNVKGRKGWPDRLLIGRNAAVFFVELKSKDEQPEPIQMYIHKLLRERGMKVFVVDDYDKLVTILKENHG